jgi:Family of unknown function (DUF5723)
MNKYIFFILLFIGQALKAQNEQALNSADYLWQSSLTNPAFMPKGKKIFVALPSAYANISLPVGLGEYVVTRDERRKLDIWSTNWISKLQDFNTIEANAQTLSFAVSVPIKNRLRLSLYHQTIANGLFDFSKDAISVIYNGNDAFIGKKVSLYNLINVNVRSEWGLGMAYQINNLSVGVRLKSQHGLMGAFTTNENLNLTTNSETYGLSLDTDYKLQTYSAGKNFTDLFFHNSGYAIDLGFKLKWENYEFAGSYLDMIGRVFWKHNAKHYISQGQHAFDGFKSINIEKTTYKQFTDTLKTALNIIEQTEQHYTQELDSRIYLSINRLLSDKLRLGVNFFIQSKPQGVLQGLSVGTMLTATATQLWDRVDVGMTLGSRSGTKNVDMGLHGAAKLFKKGQIYFVTDNIMSYILPAKAKSLNARLGFNLAFGKDEVDTAAEAKKKKKKKFKLKIKPYWYKKQRH